MDNSTRYVALIDEFRGNPAELPWVEFKVNNFDPERIGTLISAISNAARIADQLCGHVIWGIEDGTHNVVGTEMTTEERLRGCYQHAVLRFINNEGGMTNGTLRIRFAIAEKNASQISRVIKQAQEIGLVKQSDNWSTRSGYYLPFWA